MLYVIETNQYGRVIAAHPCDDGIDEAIGIIAAGSCGPEEDVGVAVDVVTARWKQAVQHDDERSAEQHFSFNRGPRYKTFALVVIN